ncbi:MAG: hypothetical protein IIA66_10240 [Planctomycetes bacterium]|nr:hypothetical protein [Planctomycetota bacterium]
MIFSKLSTSFLISIHRGTLMFLAVAVAVMLSIGCSSSDKSAQIEPTPIALQNEQPHVSGDWVALKKHRA